MHTAYNTAPPLRVLHVIETLARGGAERNLVNVLRALPASQHAVCFLRPPDDYAAQLKAHGVPVRCLGLRHPRDVPRVVAELQTEIRRGDFQVVMTQIWLSDLLGRIAGALAGVPVLSAVQTSAYEPETLATYSQAGRLKTRLIQAADSLTARLFVRRMIAVSHFVGRQTVLRLRLPAERVVVIPNSVELDLFHPVDAATRERERARLELRPDERVLVTVGKLNRGKGNDLLCAALPLVLQRHPKVRLLILGRGPDGPRLMQQARAAGVEHAVRLLGEQPDIPRYLAAADLFVFASHYEGLPLVVLEAMACRLPCLLSNIPPHQELADGGRSAVLVPPDPRAWSAAINTLLSDPAQATRLAERGFALATSRFLAPITAGALDALLRAEAAPSRWRRRAALVARLGGERVGVPPPPALQADPAPARDNRGADAGFASETGAR